MRGRKYLVVIALSWFLMAVWGAYWLTETARVNSATNEVLHNEIARGAELYAANCVICHGPVGEGVVGPPLNRDEFHGTPEENRDVFELLYNTIERGRPGTTTPHWVLLQNGQWASYTAMPTWGRSAGGPLNEQHIRSLVAFIMSGEWEDVQANIPPPRPQKDGRFDSEAALAELPSVDSLNDSQNRAAKEIFVGKGCVQCHTIGSVGGYVGPDLSKVGAWGVSADFLHQWIGDPQGTENRAPVYWSNYGGPLPFATDVTERRDAPDSENQPEVRTGAPDARTDEAERGGRDEGIGGSVGPDIPLPNTVPLGPTQMPDLFTDRPADQEKLDLLVQYLMGLK